MKSLRKITAIVLVAIFAIVVNITAFATEKLNDCEVSTNVQQGFVIAQSVTRAVTTVYQYQNPNFVYTYNDGKFKPSFDSSGARVTVAAIRTNGVAEGNITVKVYKKGILGLKDNVITFTCKADKQAHTSSSFTIKKNSDYLVEITTETALPSIVSVTIAATS